MKSTPILFSAPMVKAILAGTKTQTRRLARLPTEIVEHSQCGIVVNEMCGGDVMYWRQTHPSVDESWVELRGPYGSEDVMTAPIRAPYGVSGDRLVVLEGHALALGEHHTTHGEVLVRYLADGAERTVEMSHATVDALQDQVTVRKGRGRPGRFMPRWASRITLEILRVRVERLQDITEEDARAEGVDEWIPCEITTGLRGVRIREAKRRASAREHFAILWDSINGKRAPWSANPWLWVLDLRRVDAATGRTAA